MAIKKKVVKKKTAKKKVVKKKKAAASRNTAHKRTLRAKSNRAAGAADPANVPHETMPPKAKAEFLKMGRPSTYGPEILAKAREYLFKYREIGDQIPMVEGLAVYLNRARSTLYEWASHEEKAEFSDIMATIEEVQKKALMNGGLSGEFNSTITKLILGKHGVHEIVDTNLGGQAGNPVKMETTHSPEDAYLLMIGK